MEFLKISDFPIRIVATWNASICSLSLSFLVVPTLMGEYSSSSSLPSSKVFSKLRTLCICLPGDHKSNSTSWAMVLQVSQTLHNLTLDHLPSPPVIDLGVFHKLRFIRVSYILAPLSTCTTHSHYWSAQQHRNHSYRPQLEEHTPRTRKEDVVGLEQHPD